MPKSSRQLQREIDEALSRRGGSKSRRAHATKKTGSKINLDQIAKMFGLPEWDDVDERNQHYYYEAARGAEDEEAAETEARDELFRKWHDAVERVAEDLFGEHGLELDPLGKDKRLAYEYKIIPKVNWNEAANKIRETLNGVGYFHFNDLKEFLRSGPYTAQQAVLSHLGTIADYPAVYGSSSARRIYDAAMR